MSIGNTWLGQLQLLEVTGSQNLASASFALATVTQSTPSVIDRVAVHVNSCTETLTISLVPYVGTAFSTVVFKTSTSGRNDFFYQPDRPLMLYPGDALNVTVSNGDLTGLVYGNILQLY